MKRRIAGLKAVNSYAQGYYRDRNSGPRKPLTEEQKTKTPDVEHPVVRTHPYPDYKLPQRRLMERTTVRGSAPF